MKYLFILLLFIPNPFIILKCEELNSLKYFPFSSIYGQELSRSGYNFQSAYSTTKAWDKSSRILKKYQASYKIAEIKGDTEKEFSYLLQMNLFICHDGHYGTYSKAENEITLMCCWKGDGVVVEIKEPEWHCVFHAKKWGKSNLVLIPAGHPEIEIIFLK